MRKGLGNSLHHAAILHVSASADASGIAFDSIAPKMVRAPSGAPAPRMRRVLSPPLVRSR